jgi:YfiH family protein
LDEDMRRGGFGGDCRGKRADAAPGCGENLPEIRYSRFGGGPEESWLETKKGVVFGQFASLAGMDWLCHCFTTRLGGVSGGCFASLNLGPGKGDPDEAVRENYRRLGDAVGFDWTRSVLTKQTHTVNIRRAAEEDAGKGLLRERDYDNIDGLITDCPGLPVFAFSADCVVTLFADPVHRAVGAAHSGWRGLVGRMGREMVLAMNREFGTKPEDLVCAVAPSICRDCYEIGPEVADRFRAAFAERAGEILFPGKGDRLQADLWAADVSCLPRPACPGRTSP